MSAIFITTAYLKTQTAIAGNVDVEELNPWIEVAQQEFIKDIIGSNLYNTLNDQIVANTLTQVNTDLLNQIAPALAYFTFYKAIPFLWIKIKNKGLMINSNPETGSNSADLRSMQYLREETLSTAKFFAERVVRFICNHTEDYPTYTNQGDNPDILPRGTAYDGFYFGPMSTEEERKILRKYLGD